MTAEITDMSLRDLAIGIRTRVLSAREALDAHLARIAAVNPQINAVITLDESGAHERAARADQLTASGAEVGPLHGVPMTHKDNLDTAGIRTTNGSPLMRDRVPDTDALIIARLKRAGVNSTGKTNIPEFAVGSHTFNTLFGTTTNPYAPTLSAGGSSGGAAAVIAARVQPAGDGTDLGGSLRTPAAFCNIVGFRPSAGRIPHAPAVNPFAWLPRQGVLAREVDDAALLMACVAGPDRRNPLSLPEAGATFATPLRTDLAGLRVGWTVDFGLDVPVEPEIVERITAQIALLESLGAVVEPACPDLTAADEVYSVTRANDFAFAYRDLHREHGDVIKPTMATIIRHGLGLTGDELRAAAAARIRLHHATTGWFERYDLLMAPATQVLPFPATKEYPDVIAGRPVSILDWMRSASLISATGLPAISVPAGFGPSGLPIGLQLVAANGADLDLLHAAHAYEGATHHARIAPTPTAPEPRADRVSP